MSTQRIQCPSCGLCWDLDADENPDTFRCSCGNSKLFHNVKTEEQVLEDFAAKTTKAFFKGIKKLGGFVGKTVHTTSQAAGKQIAIVQQARKNQKALSDVIKKADFVAIDFETANHERTSACQVGVAFVSNNNVIAAKASYLRPPTLDFEPRFIALHGITPLDVQEAPTFSDVWNNWLGLAVSGKTVYAHNVSFDAGVLEACLDHNNIPLPTVRYQCTLAEARDRISDVDNYKLSTLAKYFNFDLTHHDAKSDAIACARLACAFKTGLQGFPVQPIKLAPNMAPLCQNTTFVFTGENHLFERNKVEDLLIQAGAFVRKTVTGKTDVVVIGQKLWMAYKRTGFSTDKLNKALDKASNDASIKIVSEDEFSKAFLDDSSVPV